MTEPEPAPMPRLTVVTLGVRDIHASMRFYEALGFARKVRSTGDQIAFFDAGGVVLALYGWVELAHDAAIKPMRPNWCARPLPRVPQTRFAMSPRQCSRRKTACSRNARRKPTAPRCSPPP